MAISFCYREKWQLVYFLNAIRVLAKLCVKS